MAFQVGDRVCVGNNPHYHNIGTVVNGPYCSKIGGPYYDVKYDNNSEVIPGYGKGQLHLLEVKPKVWV